MPKRYDTTVPAYRRHKASGQAIVTLDGQDFYLGTFNSAMSKAEYARVTGEWVAAGRRRRTDPSKVTIAELAQRFRRQARDFYRDAGGTVSRQSTARPSSWISVSNLKHLSEAGAMAVK